MSAAMAVEERGFTIIRRFEAPRDVVFQAWTDPAHLQWFAGVPASPEHPTTVDLRVGGSWRIYLVETHDDSSLDKAYMTGGVYREIVPPEKLVFTFGAVDGWPRLDPDNLDDAPIVSIRLTEVSGATEMQFEVRFAGGLPDARVREWLATGMREGSLATLERLADHLLLRQTVG